MQLFKIESGVDGTKLCLNLTLEENEAIKKVMMPIKVERTLFKIGEGGFAVTLPKAWVRFYQLEPGDKVEIIANDDLIIRVKASGCQDKKASLNLDH